jgi:hypothetical protein
MFRKVLLGAVFCAVGIIPAQSATQKISELLKQGYEIKSAYALQEFEGATGATGSSSDYSKLRAGERIHFIILQKADSAYFCDDRGAKYANEYRCFAINDYQESEK